MEQTTTTTCVDPASRSAPSWAARRAALKSRQVPDDDPRIIECDAALAYWRCRRIIDTERDLLDPRHIPALADMLNEPTVFNGGNHLVTTFVEVEGAGD